MRFLILFLADVVWAIRAVLELPFRAFRKRPRYVHLTLKGEIPYRAARRRRFQKGRQSLKSLELTLDRLQADPKLEGLLLEVESLELSPAKREAFAARLRAFRKAGKKVLGYGIALGNSEYELLCAADRIFLSPAGRLELVGFAAELMAVGRGLEQVGVHAEFVRRGEYKTAPELFTDETPSRIQRETMEGFLDARYEALVAAIARGRGMSEEAVRAALDAGPYGARRALAAKLIDGIATANELRAALRKGAASPDLWERSPDPDAAKPAASPGDHPPVPTVRGWERSRRWRPRPDRHYRPRPLVSVIPLSGNITHGEGATLPWGPKALGSDAVIRAVEHAADAPSKAAVLYVDSPGGSAIASELMLEAIQRLAEKKPVLAYVDRVAASGGYMAAIGAKEIWSAPNALIGSIGVFAGKFDLSQLLGRVGVHVEVIARGAHAGMNSASKPFSPAEREALEREVEETYQTFLSHVARARGQTPDWVHQRGEGRVFTGTRALERGLVDRLGSFEDACVRASEIAGVKARAVDLLLHTPSPKPRNRIERLLPSGRPGLYALWWPWVNLPDLGAPDSAFTPASSRVGDTLIEWVRAVAS